MGLFDFLKKPRTDLEECTSIFKGDLAFIWDADIEKKVEPDFADLGNERCTADNKDSADSVVFMSFAPVDKGRWICSECGTSNEECLSGCIVCGLKR